MPTPRDATGSSDGSGPSSRDERPPRDERLVLVGGGGHASDVLHAVEAGERWTVVGILDDQAIDEARFSGRGVRRVGSVADLPGIDALHVLAVGWPALRAALAERIPAGCGAATIVHPGVDVGRSTVLGEGSVILDGAHVSPRVTLGRHTLVSYLASVGHDSVVGDFTSVMPGAHVAGDCVLGDRVLVGAGAVVLQGRNVGDGATVGAGAVVTSDVPPGVTVVGAPARASHRLGGGK